LRIHCRGNKEGKMSNVKRRSMPICVPCRDGLLGALRRGLGAAVRQPRESELDSRILRFIRTRPGSKTKVIARSLSVRRRGVNKHLYGSRFLRSRLTLDENYAWSSRTVGPSESTREADLRTLVVPRVPDRAQFRNRSVPTEPLPGLDRLPRRFWPIIRTPHGDVHLGGALG
jgi:hypothetical protein